MTGIVFLLDQGCSHVISEENGPAVSAGLSKVSE